MSVLVTGATGCLGKALTKELCRRGEQVRVFVRRPMDDNFARSGLDVRYGDIRNEQDVAEAVQGVEKIFHIAAAYRSASDSDETYRQTNVEGTRNVVNAALGTGVSRLIHCSTAGVHGEIDSPPANEDSPVNPGDVYQRTKLEGEKVVSSAIRDQGLPASIFRPVGIYGPGDTRFLKLFKAVESGFFVMIGSGQVLYHLTFISDLVDGILLCAGKDEALGEVFLLAGPEYGTIQDLVERIASSLGKDARNWRVPVLPIQFAATICEGLCSVLNVEPPLHRRRLDFFTKDRAFDASKAQQTLGYEPKVGLDEGIQRTVEWYRRKGLLTA